MSGSIITPEALDRCATEAKHREHVEALRAIALAIAIKRINDQHDKMLLTVPDDAKALAEAWPQK